MYSHNKNYLPMEQPLKQDKKKRYRPGKIALAAIRKYNKNQNNKTGALYFLTKCRFEVNVLLYLQKIAKVFLASLIKDSHICCVFSEHTIITKRHVALAIRRLT